MRLFVLDVNNPDGLSLIYDRNRQENITVFGQYIKTLKTVILVSLLPMAGLFSCATHPVRSSPPIPRFLPSQLVFVRSLGGHKDQMLFMFIEQIDKNRIRIAEFRHDLDDIVQNQIEIQIFRCDIDDLLKTY